MVRDGDRADGIQRVPHFMVIIAKEYTTRPDNNTPQGMKYDI